MINLTAVTITAIICITIIILSFKPDAEKKRKGSKANKEIRIPEFMLNNKENDRGYEVFLKTYGYQPTKEEDAKEPPRSGSSIQGGINQ